MGRHAISRSLWLGQSILKCQNRFCGIAYRAYSSNLKEMQKSEAKAAEVLAEEGETLPSPVKQLFLGRIDYNIFTYPQVLEKEQLETLESMTDSIDKFYKEKVDSKKIDLDGKIPDEVLQGLKELGLFGQQASVEYGGLGLGATEYARVQEVVGRDGSIAVTLAAHQAIGFKGLLLYGNEAQKQKYLPDLASGNKIAAFALTEPGSGSDAASITTKATLSDDGKHWLLSGSKIWITNGGIADFFTVFATTAGDEVASSKKISAFLVERNFGGVTHGPPEDKLGIRGSNTAMVHFDNTPVPMENVLGNLGDGFKIAVNILNSGRFSMGSACAGGLKTLIEACTEHATQRKQFGCSLKEFGLIQQKISKMAMDTYVMESMAYMTAGLIDTKDYLDTAVESAIVKVYSSEAMWSAASEALQMFGGLGFMKDYPLERVLRDVRILPIFEGTNEILRLFIALMGSQYAGKELKSVVKKLRNPFLNPSFVLSKYLERTRQVKDRPTLTLKLKDYLHPSLEVAAEKTEYCILRMKYCIELALQNHGASLPHEQFHLKRIADCAIDLYAMLCVLSRASRSVCIGLRNGQLEVSMANIFVEQAENRIRNHVYEVQFGRENKNDTVIKSISREIFTNEGYCFEHPLKRNF